MDFVADANVERQVIETLRNDGHEVLWVAEIDCGMHDSRILAIANEQSRVLITNDKDFGELVFRQRLITSGVLLLRLGDLDGAQKARRVLELIKTHADKIKNHFSAVSLVKNRFVKL